MLGFDAHQSRVDDAVDARLGSDVWISTFGLPPCQYKAFVIPAEAPGFEETRRYWTLKIRKALLPDQDTQATMTWSKLPGTWRLASWHTDENPAYWLIKLDGVK